MKQTHKDWLRGLGIEFWLPLPLLAIAFWLSFGLITDHVLSRDYATKFKLKADTQQPVNALMNPLTIQALVKQLDGKTYIEVKTADSSAKVVKFEFLTTDINQVEGAIAQKLGLSRQDVRKLVRYELID